MKIFAYDLDGTLAESKQPITKEIVELFYTLSDHYNIKIAVISGCKMEQFKTQIAEQIEKHSTNYQRATFQPSWLLNKMEFFPTSGNAWQRWNYFSNDWESVYANIIPTQDRLEIIQALKTAVTQSGYEAKETFGPTIEDRLTQITYSALGQEAPLDLKKNWDPTAEKRKTIKRILEQTIKNYDIHYGGTTSLDITFKGIDKAYAIHKLLTHKCIKEDLTFFGDALQPGGNDYPVVTTGVKCVEVLNPQDTIIKSLKEAEGLGLSRCEACNCVIQKGHRTCGGWSCEQCY